MSFMRMALAIAAEEPSREEDLQSLAPQALGPDGGEFSPRKGDSVNVSPLGDNQFKVDGALDGVEISGIAVTWPGGGLEWRGTPPLEGDGEHAEVYATLTDVMGDADPSWAESLQPDAPDAAPEPAPEPPADEPAPEPPADEFGETAPEGE